MVEITRGRSEIYTGKWVDFQEWKFLKDWEEERKKMYVIYMRLYGPRARTT